jgi:hypothetical protein
MTTLCTPLIAPARCACGTVPVVIEDDYGVTVICPSRRCELRPLEASKTEAIAIAYWDYWQGGRA